MEEDSEEAEAYQILLFSLERDRAAIHPSYKGDVTIKSVRGIREIKPNFSVDKEAYLGEGILSSAIFLAIAANRYPRNGFSSNGARRRLLDGVPLIRRPTSCRGAGGEGSVSVLSNIAIDVT
ncbi:hypothetical protein J437_LFUL010192, partial [Ladona fulva]